MLKTGDQFPDYEVFTYWHAFFLVGAIVTYIVDLSLDIVVSATYFYDGYIWYGSINLGLVLVPTILVQIFSIRWFQMDSMMKKSYWYIHALLMGVIQRYLMVLTTGFEAMKSGDPIDYQRFYQQQSDVCMLRLFDSFAESAPQLVFHLYVMILKSQWPIEQAAWTGTSAVISMISLGWGIAAYSSALRMTREDKNKLSWTGMILQTFWRVGMLSARLTALVMLALALHQWTFIVMFVHWLVMTGWVLWQNTDFCQNPWEERLYNSVVGIIYCFCFFNLKEGRSRVRAATFYAVIIVENFCFVAIFYYLNNLKVGMEFSYWISVGAFSIVLVGTLLGLCGMLLYYRFFHPAGPIKPFVGQSVDFVVDPDIKHSPDFVIHDASGISCETSTSLQHRRHNVPHHSRSFKMSCPPPRREVRSRPRHDDSIGATSDVGPSLNASPVSGLEHSRTGFPTMTSERIDSTYGTDSNRTVSPQDAKSEPAQNISNTSSLSIAFNNDTYASVDTSSFHNNVEKKDFANKNECDVSYASVNPRTPKSRSRQVTDGNGNETYMSIHPAGNDEPEVLLKRSPVVRDVTTAHISPTIKLSNDMTSSKEQYHKALPPLPVARKLSIEQRESDNLSAYKSLSSIPGIGRKLSENNSSTKDVVPSPLNSAQSESGYKLLSSIPGAGKNLQLSENNVEQKVDTPNNGNINKTNNIPTKKLSTEKLTAPLTIIVPNISRAFARHSRSRSGDDVTDLSEKTISMELLNPKATDYSHLSSHDYENLALININRTTIARGIAHWRTYSDMADNQHDDSVACDRRNKDYSNYASMHYFDIYPLSREIKEQLYRSLTPVSTTATIATSDDGILTNSNDSDTYEPIETFQDLFASASAKSLKPENNENCDVSKKQDSLNDTYGDLKVPVPVTLIHHDGTHLTTRQIMSMESLREVIRKHEKVPMDDPQDRGDLYLLAPMRLLLSPIAEETESSEAPSQINETTGQDFNKSLMTVISELLSTTYSNKSFLHSTAFPHHQPSQLQQFHPDGHFQDSVDSASSLVHIIDEIRNNSLCNLLYMTNSSGDINATGDRENTLTSQSAANQVKHHSSPIKNLQDHLQSTCMTPPLFTSKPIEPVTQAASATTVIHNRDGSVKSVKSSALPSSPSKKTEAYYPGVRKTPPMYSSVSLKAVHSDNSSSNNAHTRDSSVPSVSSNTLVSSPVKDKENVYPGNRKTSPLYTSVGSRKNLLDLAGASAESTILNTPIKIGSESLKKFSLASSQQPPPVPSKSPHETRKLGYYQPNQSDRSSAIDNGNATQRPLNFVDNHQNFEFQSRSSTRLVHPKPVNFVSQENNFSNSGLPKPFGNNSIHHQSASDSFSLSMQRPSALSHFPALSPSAKYTTDNTPTPPLRANQFVRRVTGTGSNVSKLPRRKFSIIRDQFESPEVKRRTNSGFYENVSSEASMAATTRNKCKSVPDVFPEFELLRADEKYNDKFGAQQFEQKSRFHWSTASFQKVPPSSVGHRNVPNRRSMSILSESSTTTANSFHLPPRRPAYLADNKENQGPEITKKLMERAPAIPPRASTRLVPATSNKSTLSPKSRVFSKLI